MTIDVFFSPVEVDEPQVEGRVAVVIDVIRATSTMVQALANGARGIYPTVSTEEAIKLASSLGREDSLLCGERRGLKVEGFDLGNSPAEFTKEVVGDKQLLMTTTNGTRALLAVEDAHRVLVLSFLNLTAVADALRDVGDLVVVCAGREDRFALDDALCAGMLIRSLLEGEEGNLFHAAVGDSALNDGARAALDLAQKYPLDVEFLRSTAAGSALLGIGLESDLELVAALDRYNLVPEMRERRVALPVKKGSKKGGK